MRTNRPENTDVRRQFHGCSGAELDESRSSIIANYSAATPYWLFEDFKKIGIPYNKFPIEMGKYTTEDAKKLKDDFGPAKRTEDPVQC